MNGVLVLAAGLSRRYGSDKRLADIGTGKPLLEQTLAQIVEADMAFLVVLRHDDLDYIDELTEKYPRGHFVRCPESALGMGYSLSFGVEQARFRRFTGIVVALGDMPGVEPATYRAVGRQLKSDNIIVPRHQERTGNPVGFGSDFFDELKSIRGDRGAKEVWQNHPDRVEYLDLQDQGILIDIDIPDDIARLDPETDKP